MITVKLNKCKNCFRITTSSKYIAACGDSITIYLKDNFSVYCTIPSKQFNHPYHIKFLSEDTFVVNNLNAEYMIYDLVSKCVIWQFRVKGWRCRDDQYLLSSNNDSLYDILISPNKTNSFAELLVSIPKKCYVLRTLHTLEPTQPDWKPYQVIHLANDDADGIYASFMFGPPHNPSHNSHSRGIQLLHKESFGAAQFQKVREWPHMREIRFHYPWSTGYTCNSVIYLDKQLIIFQNLELWNLQTDEYAFLCNEQHYNSGISIARKQLPDSDENAFFLHEHTGFTTKRICVLSEKNKEPLKILDSVPGTDDYSVCDVVFLDSMNKMLIGTMSGLYLCVEPQFTDQQAESLKDG